MIPKIIHYCWLSGDKYPPAIDRCISSWKSKLPDYEFILWDKNRFNINNNIWVRQAFQSKKYAFAADYIRLYALYHHGGIYLDSDVEVVKSFDELLCLPYFIGFEVMGNVEGVEAGVFGAERKCEWVKNCLDHYTNRSFIKEDGNFDMQTLPRIMMAQITKKRAISEVTINDFAKLATMKDDNKFFIFPHDYFCAKDHGTGIVTITKNTFCVHHFAMSWIPKRKTFISTIKKKLMATFGVRSIELLITACRLRELKRKFTKR